MHWFPVVQATAGISCAPTGLAAGLKKPSSSGEAGTCACSPFVQLST